MSEITKKWYVLRAVSGKENKVKEYLDADIRNSNLGEYVSQVLIPTEKVYQVRNGKKIVKERSYLPGYVLVEAALVGEVAHHLRNNHRIIFKCNFYTIINRYYCISCNRRLYSRIRFKNIIICRICFLL